MSAMATRGAAAVDDVMSYPIPAGVALNDASSRFCRLGMAIHRPRAETGDSGPQRGLDGARTWFSRKTGNLPIRTGSCLCEDARVPYTWHHPWQTERAVAMRIGDNIGP